MAAGVHGAAAAVRPAGRRPPERLPIAATIYRATPWNGHGARNVLQALAVQMMVPPLLACWDDFDMLYGDQAERAKPKLLLADEIQRMGDDKETQDLLYHLHDQTTFPVVPVCGGLSTSAAHLRELGLSQLADVNVLRIGALTAEEAQRCLDESLHMVADDVGIDGHPDRWARQLAPATDGWPQHITCHIRAAATALRMSGRPAFDDGNLNRALAPAQAAIREYYEQRLEEAKTQLRRYISDEGLGGTSPLCGMSVWRWYSAAGS